LERIRQGLARFQAADPEVSIVIPAYNEENELLRALSSLSQQETQRRVELLVINNNSSDSTQEILDACGVRSIFEPRQGISFTRQTGLESAKGRYYLSADADSVYPPGWVDAYVNALEDPGTTCAYGRYSFLPSPQSKRFWLAIHEIAAESWFHFRRRNRDYLNVMGFNFAFRRKDGLDVGGFNIARQRWQDGWMAMQLGKRGKIALLLTESTRVWTSDRRLIADGNLRKAFWRRLRMHSAKLRRYLRDDAKQPPDAAMSSNGESSSQQAQQNAHSKNHNAQDSDAMAKKRPIS
jgi:glycosyltransferase involved in cell wall biosynthesis